MHHHHQDTMVEWDPCEDETKGDVPWSLQSLLASREESLKESGIENIAGENAGEEP